MQHVSIAGDHLEQTLTFFFGPNLSKAKRLNQTEGATYVERFPQYISKDVSYGYGTD